MKSEITSLKREKKKIKINKYDKTRGIKKISNNNNNYDKDINKEMYDRI